MERKRLLEQQEILDGRDIEWMANNVYFSRRSLSLELHSNCCNSVQTWVSTQVAGFLLRKLGAMRNTFVTDEKASRRSYS